MKEVNGIMRTSVSFEIEVRIKNERKRGMIENFDLKHKDDWKDSSLLKTWRYRLIKWVDRAWKEKINLRKYLKFT